jgi:hypothetical protein
MRATTRPEPTPSPTPTPVSPSPTPIPEKSYEEKLSYPLHHELVLTVADGLRYFERIGLAVAKEMFTRSFGCGTLPSVAMINGACPKLDQIQLNLSAYPDSAQRIKEAVLVSMTFALRNQDPEQFGSDFGADQLKSMIQAGDIPTLRWPNAHTENSPALPATDVEADPIRAGLSFHAVGPGFNTDYYIDPALSWGIRIIDRRVILETYDASAFGVATPKKEHTGPRTCSGFACRRCPTTN